MIIGSGGFYFGTGSLPQGAEEPQFYGADEFNTGSAFPTNLTAYQNVDGAAVLYWSLDPISGPLYHDIDWTVETDLVPTFDSVDLLTYKSSMAQVVFTGTLTSSGSVYVVINGVGMGVSLTTGWFANLTGLANAFGPTIVGVLVTNGDITTITYTSIDDSPVNLNSATNLGIPGVVVSTVTSAENYIAGCVNKGMVVPTYARQQGEARTMYWRVKGTLGAGSTNFVDSTFEIASAVDYVVKKAMLDSLPSIIYKNDLDLMDKSTNLAKLYHALGLEFDMLHMDGVLVGNDAYTRSVRDMSLANNFGRLLEISQPTTMETIDFREILRVYMREAGYSPTIGSVRRVIKAIFGVDPDFTFIRDTLETYVDDPSSVPPVEEFWVDDTVDVVDASTVWDNANLSFGVIININAPLGCTISRAFVENIVFKLTPAFAPVYITGI